MISVQAETLAQEWADCFPAASISNCSAQDIPMRRVSCSAHLALASTLRLPVVATHPVQFLNPEDYRAHEARVCIAEGYVLGDRRRPRHCTEEQYFKTKAEMAELFADIPVCPGKHCRIGASAAISHWNWALTGCRYFPLQTTRVLRCICAIRLRPAWRLA